LAVYIIVCCRQSDLHHPTLSSTGCMIWIHKSITTQLSTSDSGARE